MTCCKCPTHDQTLRYVTVEELEVGKGGDKVRTAAYCKSCRAKLEDDSNVVAYHVHRRGGWWDQ